LDLTHYEVLVIISAGESLTGAEAEYGGHQDPPIGDVHTMDPEGGGIWKRHLHGLYQAQALTDAELFCDFCTARKCKVLHGPCDYSSVNKSDHRDKLRDFLQHGQNPKILYYVGHTLDENWYFSYRHEAEGAFINHVLDPAWFQGESRSLRSTYGGPLLIVEAPNSEKWIDDRSRSYTCIAAHERNKPSFGCGFLGTGSPLTRYICGLQPAVPPHCSILQFPITNYVLTLPRFDTLWTREDDATFVYNRSRGLMNPKSESQILDGIEEIHLADFPKEELYRKGVLEIIIDRLHHEASCAILEKMITLLTEEEKRVAVKNVIAHLKKLGEEGKENLTVVEEKRGEETLHSTFTPVIKKESGKKEGYLWRILYLLRLPIPYDVWFRSFTGGLNRDMVCRCSVLVSKEAVVLAREACDEEIGLLTRLWIHARLPRNLAPETLTAQDGVIAFQILAAKLDVPPEGFIQILLIRFPADKLVQLWGMKALKAHWIPGSEGCVLCALDVNNRNIRIAAIECINNAPLWPLQFAESTLMLLVHALKQEVLEAIDPIKTLLFRRDVREGGVKMNWKSFTVALLQVPKAQKKHHHLYPDPLICSQVLAKAFTAMQLYPAECGPLVWENWKEIRSALGDCQREKDEASVLLPCDAHKAMRSLGDTLALALMPHSLHIEKRMKAEAERRRRLAEAEDSSDEEGDDTGGTVDASDKKTEERTSTKESQDGDGGVTSVHEDASAASTGPVLSIAMIAKLANKCKIMARRRSISKELSVQEQEKESSEFDELIAAPAKEFADDEEGLDYDEEKAKLKEKEKEHLRKLSKERGRRSSLEEEGSARMSLRS